MYKNKLCPICPTLLQKLFPYNDKHYSQHAFDQYSIVHFTTGLLLTLFIKKISIIFLFSRLFEFYENSQFLINIHKKLGYKLSEDSLLNSIVDDLCVGCGSFIGNKIGFYKSIKLYFTILFLQKNFGFSSNIDLIIEQIPILVKLFKNNKNNKN
jgi:hypothetical protein